MLGDDAATAQAQLRGKFSDATTIVRNAVLERLPDANIRFPRLTGGQFRLSRDRSETQFDVVSDDFVRGGSGTTGGVSLQDTIVPPPAAGGNGGGGGGNGGGGTFDFTPESGGVPGGMDTVDTPLSQSDSQSGRFAAYLRELGNRGFTSGLGRQLQERRFAPAQSAFFGEEALGQLTDPDRTAGTFEQFLRGAPAGLGGFGSRARTAFGNLAGIAGASPQPEFGAIDPNTGFATRLPSQDLLSEYQDPDFENSRIGENLSNLALAAARANVAPIVGNQLFRSDRFNPFNLRSQFQAQRGTGGSGNFVDFLQGKFGLGG